VSERSFSTHQVASLLGSTPAAVSDWIDRGWLPSERLADGSPRVSVKGLTRFLADRGVNPTKIVTRPVPTDASSPDVPPPLRPAASLHRGAPGVAAQVAAAVLEDAVRRRADAIHFDPRADGLALRLRIGGRLHAKPNFPGRLTSTVESDILARLKMLADLDPAEHTRPQAGRFRTRIDGRDVTFRLATYPTSHGEKVFLQLFDPGAPQS